MPTPDRKKVQEMKLAETKTTDLDFFTALQFVRDGARIRRLSWDDQDAFCMLEKNAGRLFDKLTLWLRGLNAKEWIIMGEDMHAVDWEVVKD